MRGKLNLILFCSLLSGILGCVSKADFQLVSNDNRLAQEEIKKLHKRIEEMERANTNCQKTMIRIEELERTNTNCQKAMIRNEAIISVQSRVIKLIDDPKHTLQKSIQEQLLEQNVEIDNPLSNP